MYEIRPLDERTWGAFAALVERHRGIWGGCWCIAFHAEGAGKGRTAALNRADKAARVAAGTAHAALVFAGDLCVGWCQYGPPAELPRIKHRRAYEAAPSDPPGWRITCFFVDRDWRGRGVAEAALAGALRLIGEAGGGRVESFPEEVGAGRSVSSSFLHNGVLSTFEAQGFRRVRKLGKDRWLVDRSVAAG